MDQPPLVRCQLLQTHDTPWDPSTVTPTLNVTLDACIVPSKVAGGARVDAAHLVVLDAFIDEPIRQGLMDALVGQGWRGPHPPADRWQRATCDAAALPPTWGLQDWALRALGATPCWAMVEVQSRLAKLWREVDVAHMPSDAIQDRAHLSAGQPEAQPSTRAEPPPAAGAATQQRSPQAQQQQQQQQQQQMRSVGRPSDQRLHPSAQESPPTEPSDTPPPSPSAQPAVDCAPYVANAAVAGDHFRWHVDADPWSFPPSPWTRQHGCYINREPGKPLLVSVLLYLDEAWEREWDAETLFLDTGSDTGILVRPKRHRAVLMDQDVLHRVSAPSQLAGRPRYSLVWKLALLPRGQQGACLARAEWGPPTAFGSAAKVAAAARQVAARQQSASAGSTGHR